MNSDSWNDGCVYFVKAEGWSLVMIGCISTPRLSCDKPLPVEIRDKMYLKIVKAKIARLQVPFKVSVLKIVYCIEPKVKLLKITRDPKIKILKTRNSWYELQSNLKNFISLV